MLACQLPGGTGLLDFLIRSTFTVTFVKRHARQFVQPERQPRLGQRPYAAGIGTYELDSAELTLALEVAANLYHSSHFVPRWLVSRLGHCTLNISPTW